MGTPNADFLMLGAGSLFFDRIDNATKQKTGERHLGDCKTFTFAPGAEVLEYYESMDKDRSLYKAVVKQVTATGKLSMSEFDPRNLALALLGETSTINQSAGSVAAGASESHTVKKSHMYKLGGNSPVNQKFNINPSSIVVKKGATTLMVDRDYILVNAACGVLFFPENEFSTLTDGDNVTITYDYLSSTIRKIVGGTKLKIEGLLRFIGDPTSGPRYEGEFWHVVITPDGDLNFIGDDWGNFNLNFECLDDSMNHASEPYYRLLKY